MKLESTAFFSDASDRSVHGVGVVISVFVATLSAITYAMSRVFIGQAARADDAWGNRWLHGKATAAREFAKVGAIFIPCAALPVDVGIFLAQSQSRPLVPVATALVLSALCAIAVRAGLHRYPEARPNMDFWGQQSNIEFDSLRRRSGVVFWAMVTMLLLIGAFAVLALVLTARA